MLCECVRMPVGERMEGWIDGYGQIGGSCVHQHLVAVHRHIACAVRGAFLLQKCKNRRVLLRGVWPPGLRGIAGTDVDSIGRCGTNFFAGLVRRRHQHGVCERHKCLGQRAIINHPKG